MKIKKTFLTLFVVTFSIAYYSAVVIDDFRFMPTSRGCGCGYIQTYKTIFGNSVFEGHYCISDDEFREKTNLGRKLLERTDGTIVWEFITEEETYVEILKYSDGHVFVKHASNLELAIEFEEWLKDRKN
jgi:hypothetical protein